MVFAMLIIAIEIIGIMHIINIPLVKFPVTLLVIARGNGPRAEAVIITIVAEPCTRPNLCLPYMSAQITLLTILPVPLLAPNMIE